MKKKRVAFIFSIIFMGLLSYSSCVFFFIDTEEEELIITITNIMHEGNSDNMTYTISWTTQEVAISTLYYGTDPTQLTEYVGTKEKTNDRSITLAGLKPNTTYYYKILSTIDDTTAESEIDSFTTYKAESYDITGILQYTKTNQPTGNYVLELWSSNTFDYSTETPKTFSYIHTQTSFNISITEIGSYYIRVFKDYDSNGYYDNETDAIYNHSSMITIGSNLTTDLGTLTLVEPEQIKKTINIDYVSSYSIQNNGTLNITYSLKDQWDNLYISSDNETLNLMSVNSNVAITVISNSDTDNDGIINAVMTLSTISDTTTTLKATWGTTEIVAETNTITITTANSSGGGSGYFITGTFTHTETYQTTGLYILELWNSSSNYDYNTEIPQLQAFNEPGTFSVSVVASTSYNIRIFRDFNANGRYDSETDTIYIHPDAITISSSNIDINTVNLTEPTQIKKSLSISNITSYFVISGNSINITYNLKDQWGNIYNTTTNETLTLSATNGVSINPTSQSDEDGDGIISTNLTLNSGVELSTVITASWNGESISTDTNPITVNTSSGGGSSYVVYGTFEYTQVYQPAGLYILELWNSTSNFDYNVSTPELRIFTEPTFFNISVSNNASYKFRIFRDFNANGQYDIDTDSIYTYSNVITISDASHDMGTITLTEPSRIRTLVELNSIDTHTIIIGNQINVSYHLKDQWDQLFTNSATETLTFSSDIPITPNTASDSDSDGIITAALQLSTPTTTVIRASWTNSTSFADTNTITVLGTGTYFNISGQVTNSINDPHQPAGTIRVEAWSNYDSSNGHTFSGTLFKDTTTDGSGNYTLDTIPDGASVYIRAYMDYTGTGGTANQYTQSFDSFGFYGSPTPVSVSGSDIPNIDFNISLEPTRIVTFIEIPTATDPTSGGNISIVSGDLIDTTDFNVLTRDQWSNTYGDVNVSIDLSFTNANVNIIPANISLNLDGKLSVSSIQIKNSNAISNTGQIKAIINGTTREAITANFITTELNTISGNVTNTVATPNQPSGTMKAEAWDNDTFNGTRYDVANVDGLGNYVLNNIPSTGNIYIRAFYDYDNNDDNYNNIEDSNGLYGQNPIVMNGENKTGIDIGVNIEPSQEIGNITVISDPSPTTITSGNSVSFNITAYNQWGSICTDTSKSVNISWANSDVSITPSNVTLGTDGKLTITSFQLKNAVAGPSSNTLKAISTGSITVEGATSNNITVSRNQITGKVTYSVTAAKQTSGTVKVEAWDSATFNGTRYDVVGVDGSDNYTFTSIPSNANVYLRAIYDYDGDDAYDSYNEGSGTYISNPLIVGGVNQSNINFNINTEPTQTITNIIIATQPNANIVSGDNINIVVNTKDQWDNIYGDDTVNLTTDNANITIVTNSAILANGIATFNSQIKNSDAGANSGTFTATLQSDGSKNITTNSVNVGRNEISGRITNVTTTNQPTGTIKVEAWNNATFDGTRYDITGVDGGNNYTLTNIPSTGTIYIRSFYDYDNAGSSYDSIEDSVDVYSTDGSFVMTGINQSGIDFDVDGEPTQVISAVNITNQPATSIKSSENISIGVTAYDQWGNVYGNDNLDFTWNISTGNNVNIITNTATLSNGIATLNTVLKNSTGGPNTGTIKAILQSDAGKYATTNALTVNKNQITGTINYNVSSPKQTTTTGRIKVEACDSATFDGTRYALSKATVDGKGDFNYTLTEIPAGNVYLRAFYDNDNANDTIASVDGRGLYDGVDTSGTIVMTGEDKTNINFSIVEEAPQEISSLAVTSQPTSNIGTGTNVSLQVKGYDQWGNIFGNESLTFSWTGSNVSLGTTSTNLVSGTASLTTSLTNTNDGPNTSAVKAALTSNASIYTETNSVTVHGDTISGTISYTQEYQNSGDIYVQLIDSGDLTVLDQKVISYPADPITYEFTSVEYNNTVYILAFRDADSDDYDVGNDTDNRDAANWTADITMTGANKVANLTLFEPAQELTSLTLVGIDVNANPSVDNTPLNINGVPVFMVIQGNDQWNNAYAVGNEVISFSIIQGTGPTVSITPSPCECTLSGTTNRCEVSFSPTQPGPSVWSEVKVKAELSSDTAINVQTNDYISVKK